MKSGRFGRRPRNRLRPRPGRPSRGEGFCRRAAGSAALPAACRRQGLRGAAPDQGLDDSYLYAGRPIDPSRIVFPATRPMSSSTYTAFDGARRNIELGFAIMFVLLALTMVFSAVWLGSDLRQSTGRADPSLDPRHRRSGFGQSLCSGADTPLGRRLGPSRRDLQQDDARTEPAAEPAGRGQRAHRRAARFHRGGAVGRSCRRHRRRRPRDHHGQQRGRRAAARRAEPGGGLVGRERRERLARARPDCAGGARDAAAARIRGRRSCSAMAASAS